MRRKTPYHPQDVAAFAKRLRGLLANQDHDKIINFDETRVNVVPKIQSTITHKGSESVHLTTNSDPHAAFTAGISATASGKILPLFVVTTEALYNDLSRVDEAKAKVFYSARSCMTTTLMIKYLCWLRAVVEGVSDPNEIMIDVADDEPDTSENDVDTNKRNEVCVCVCDSLIADEFLIYSRARCNCLKDSQR